MCNHEDSTYKLHVFFMDIVTAKKADVLYGEAVTTATNAQYAAVAAHISVVL